MKLQLKYNTITEKSELSLAANIFKNQIWKNETLIITLLYENNNPIKINLHSLYTFPNWKLIENILKD